MNLLLGTMKKAMMEELDKLADSPIYPSDKLNDEEYYSTKLGKDPKRKNQKGFYFRSSNDITLRK